MHTTTMLRHHSALERNDMLPVFRLSTCAMSRGPANRQVHNPTASAAALSAPMRRRPRLSAISSQLSSGYASLTGSHATEQTRRLARALRRMTAGLSRPWLEFPAVLQQSLHESADSRG